MVDYFNNFEGFGVEEGWSYIGFCREDPVVVAKDILRQYVGQTARIFYDAATPQGIVTMDKDKVILTEDSIDRLFGGLIPQVTDSIRFFLLGADLLGYNIQRIKIGKHEISQIETK